jgi:hypothetical protein
LAVSTRAVPRPHLAGVATVTAQTQEALWSPAGTLATVGNLPRQRTQVVQELADPMRFSSPMRVVKIPVVGQPGQFVTGLLPLASTSPIRRGPGRGQAPSLRYDPTRNLTLTLRMKIVLLVAAILLIAAGLAGFLWFTHHIPARTSSRSVTVVTTEIL